MNDFLHTIEKWIPLGSLAAFGGLVRCLSGERQLNFKVVLVEIIIAIFAGVLISLIISPFDLSPQMQAAAAALGGYSSKAVLYIIEQAFLKKVKKEIDEP